MPVLVLRDRCDNLPRCFAASVCPNQALFYDERKGQVMVLPERCGDCRGPCLNFCDRYAIRYAPTLEELRLLQAELDGSMSAEEIARERLRLKKAEEERQQSAIPDVTSATFQREVLEARLPVLLLVDSARSGVAKRIGPVLEQLSRRYVSQLLIRRLNSDAEPRLVMALSVRRVPTFLAFFQGQVVAAVEGLVSASQLQTWVEELLEQVRGLGELPAQGLRPAGPGGERRST